MPGQNKNNTQQTSKTKVILLLLILVFVFGLVIAETGLGGEGFSNLLGRQKVDFLNGGANREPANLEPTNLEPTSTSDSLTGVNDETTQAMLTKTSLSEDDFYRGNPETAKIVLIEFMDLNCSHCKIFHETMERVIGEFGDDLLWVVRQYPVLGSDIEAQAALCVGITGENDKYYDFIAKYFAEPVNPTLVESDKREVLEKMSNSIGIDIKSCLESDEAKARIGIALNEGKQLGILGTPSTVLLVKDTGTQELLSGAYSFEDMKQVVSSYLN